MRISNTTGTYDGYYTSYEEKIKALYEIGYRYIDISLYNTDCFKERFMRDDWEAEAKKLKAFSDALGVRLVLSHAPNTNPLAEDNMIDFTKRAIEVLNVLGIDRMVYHAGWEAGIDKENFFRRNEEYLRELLPLAEANNIKLLVENGNGANQRNMYYFFTGSDMREFIEKVNHPLLHACWDIGHANIEGHQYEDIMVLGEHLLAIHVHDNKGKADYHELLFTGTVNMDEVMCALIDSHYKGYFTFETERILRPASGVFERSQKLIMAPVKIKDMAEKLCYEMGKYILESYACFDE